MSPADLGAALERDAFVAAVLEANPGLEEARQALAAARAAPSTVVADAPRVTATLSLSARPSVEVDVPVPIAGMLRADRAMARAQADAAAADVDAMRLDLAESAAMLWAEDALVAREIAIDDEHAVLLDGLAKAADARVAAGMGMSDALTARLDAAMVQRDQVDLARQADEIRARMNALLHQPVDAPLPPPADVAPADASTLPSADVVDVAQRPDVVKADADVRAMQAGVTSASRAWVPEPMAMAGYDAMWMDKGDRWMVGVGADLPMLQPRARKAAVDEAGAKLAGAQAMRDRIADEAAADVAVARRDVDAARETLRIDEETVVPLAQERLEAARSAWLAGGEFLMVVEAERDLLDARKDAAMARMELDKAVASYVRAVGGAL